jgi:hypothetical protein
MKRVIRRIVTLVTTVTWLVEEDGGEHRGKVEPEHPGSAGTGHPLESGEGDDAGSMPGAPAGSCEELPGSDTKGDQIDDEIALLTKTKH